MIVVFAEKPSVGRDIARILGAGEKKKGYQQGNGYCVTWGFGHLVQIAEPDRQNALWKKWQRETLPMLPETFELEVITDKTEQFDIIRNLFLKATSIVNAADAGREGELIFNWTYTLSQSSAPVQRLWISDLTDQSIRAGFHTLKPASHYKNLSLSAESRAYADWLIGMNATRAYSIHNGTLCTIGRVQTPTLAIIVDRHNEIANFEVTPYFELHAWVQGADFKWEKRKGFSRIEGEEQARELELKCKGKPGRILEISEEQKKIAPPALFDLAGLQQEASKKFGFTATQTLNLAQELYEKYKLISYPRTDSKHLSKELEKGLPNVVKALPAYFDEFIKECLQRIEMGPGLGKAYVDDKKLTDHHAIIPTTTTCPEGLPEPIRKLYGLIARRFLSIFLAPAVEQHQEALMTIGEDAEMEHFRGKGKRIAEHGWRRVYADIQKKETQILLPEFQKGQIVEIEKLEVQKKETQPPKPYSDGTLISAMENVARKLADAELKTFLKARGLGTPATRAEIIEKLIRTKYVNRNKRILEATQKGIDLIRVVIPKLKDPQLTAEWEQQLYAIEVDQGDTEAFMKEIKQFIQNTIPDVFSSDMLQAEDSPMEEHREVLGSCPKCETGLVVATPKAYSCNRWQAGCEFKIWKLIASKAISKTQAKNLVRKGSSDLIKGFKSKSGNKFDTVLKLNEQFQVVFSFPEKETSQKEPPIVLGPCPSCGDGQVIEGKKGFGCDQWRKGCKFVIWKEIARKIITREIAEELLINGQTGLLDGFTNKENAPFSACLVLDRSHKVIFGRPAY